MTHNLMHRKVLLAGLLASILLLAGCGPSLPPTIYVKGIVTLDGNPVEGAAVLFSPEEGRPASGITDAQGEFELQTFEPRDGAVLGTHKVTVTLKKVTGVGADPDGLSGEIAPGGMQIDWGVPERYSNPATTDLSVTVDGDLKLPVELKLTSG